MKINRLGYLTVEIIIASAIAISFAIFLMDVTVKLVNITDDAYIDTEIITDKALIIKNIKSELEKNKGQITNISCGSGRNGNNCTITLNNNSTKTLNINDGVLTYGDYSKKLNTNITNWSITGSINNNYVLIVISGTNKFSKNDFNANIIVYNG